MNDPFKANRCFIIGEVAQAHDGSLGTAHAYVDAIANTGADAVKFQTHIACAESTRSEPWRIRFSVQDESRFAYWKRMEFTEDQWLGLKRHAEEKRLQFLSSPFSLEAAKMLRRIGTAIWKIASGETNNPQLFEFLIETELPVLLSTGMSTMDEVDRAVARVQASGIPLAVLQCTSVYPCPPEKVGLNLIPYYRDRYECAVGLSDHSGTIFPSLAAASIGAEVLEVHVALSRECFGPDVVASVTTQELAAMVEGVRFIERMRSHSVVKDEMARELAPVRKLFMKSIVAKMDLPSGTWLTADCVTVKKPGTGIPAERLPLILGRRVRRTVAAGQMLLASDLTEEDCIKLHGYPMNSSAISVLSIPSNSSEPVAGMFDSQPKCASFEKIEPGDEVHFSRTITGEDLEAFAKLSGDRNPLHMDERFAARTHFQRRVVHGMLLANYVSALVGMHCPGPGALWSQQSFRWRAPVFIGDCVLLSLKVRHKSAGSRALTIEIQAVNQNGRVVMDGEGVVTVLEDSRNGAEVSVNERVAFVSGGLCGTGAAICSALAEAGIPVVVNYRKDSTSAEDLCAAIRDKGGRAISVQADVTVYSSIVAATQQAQDYFKHPVNILINNQVFSPEPQPFVQTTWEQIQSAFEVHVRGAYHCSQAVIPGMLERKWGRIINLGSVFTRSTPPANWSAFLLAKAALQAMTRCMAAELGPHGICVNTVAPGIVETESIAGLSDRARKVQAMQTPLRRLASPTDIAATIVALCGDAGSFITGAELPVCGGLQM